MLSPLGTDVPSTWQGILAGRSGIGLIEHTDLSAYSTRFGGSVKGFNVEEYLSVKEARKLDLFIQYGLAAGFQAVRNAGLEVTDANRERIGVAMGSGIGGLTNIEETSRTLHDSGRAHFAVLRAGLDHQHDFRFPVDPPGPAGAELRHRHRLHHRYPLHRHGRAQHRLRRS
jgi:3-oxoacyl-(acyl-carrier-protein) synthase